DQSDHRDHAADQLPDLWRRRGRDGVRVPRLRTDDARGGALQGHRAGRGRRPRLRLPRRPHQHPGRRRLHGARSPHPDLTMAVPATADVVAAWPTRAAAWRLRARLLASSTPACVGLALVLGWVVVAVLAPLIARYPPNATSLAAIAHTTPSGTHWL